MRWATDAEIQYSPTKYQRGYLGQKDIEALAYAAGMYLHQKGNSMSKGRINQYTCPICKGKITTIDRDEGTTPSAISCRATEGCKGDMFSSFYNVSQNLTPGFEWFRPISTDGYPPEMIEHFRLGGLDIRQIESAGNEA